jgi:hydrogenase small subunit
MIMDLTRRDFLRATSAIAASLTLRGQLAYGATRAGANAPPVVWIQAQGCSGCSVSLLNTIHYMTADTLLAGTINLNYHSTLMSAAGDMASAEAMSTALNGGYVLVVEGAIPMGAFEDCCYLWPGMTAWDGVRALARNAARVIAVGSCSSYGGVVAGSPNPTNAGSVADCIGKKRVINIPGCPAHPDWIVGTVATLLRGRVPELDSARRPKMFFSTKVHERCPYKDDEGPRSRCLIGEGCRGKEVYSDCPTRRWNASSPQGFGVNWCVGAGSPCHGCTEPNFPDGMSPFFVRGLED